MTANFVRILSLVGCIPLGMAPAGCKKHPELQLRTDAGPLQNRLRLPSHISSVRWVAVSPVKDSGWIPPKIEFYDIYAYLELNQDEWAAFQSLAGPPGATASFEIPEAAARALKLSMDTAFHAEGLSFTPESVSAGPKSDVIGCLRMKNALVIHFRAS